MSRTKLPHEWVASPNIEQRNDGKTPTILLLHYTGMKSAENARDWLCDPQSKVSCHYLIDEKGHITQMVDEEMRAWHAGQASWTGEGDINSRSIGIEMHNAGHLAGYPDFPRAQIEQVAALCRDILTRHAIPPQNVLAHSDVAPRRKIDPGEKFDWKYLHAQGIGHWVSPVPSREGTCLRRGDTGENVREIQSILADYGYGVDVTGRFDPLTEAVVKAFQRHFRIERIDGIADYSTIETLRRLIRAVPE